MVEIVNLTAADLDRHLPALAALLQACVQDGAAIGFVLPFPREAAARFWTETVRPGVAAGTRVLLVAEAAGKVIGTGQLNLDTPPNQPHRADVCKLMVDPTARRQGAAKALMQALEAAARGRGRRLLTLDTRSGDRAEALYLGLGYQPVGLIPGYALNATGDGLHATLILYKELAPLTDG